MENKNTFDQQTMLELLSRMARDCKSFVEKNCKAEDLWAKSPENQIRCMRDILSMLDSEHKPDWMNSKDIDSYEKRMCQNVVKKEDKVPVKHKEAEKMDKYSNVVIREEGVKHTFGEMAVGDFFIFEDFLYETVQDEEWNAVEIFTGLLTRFDMGETVHPVKNVTITFSK